MFSLIFTWLALAVAASPELTVERARVAIEIGDPARAAELALEASQAGEPRGRDVYLQALVGAGLGDRALVEVAALPAHPLPWSAELAALDHALGAGDVKGTVVAAKALEQAFPDHPDLLVPLWEMPAVPGALRRHRQAHAARVAGQVAKRASDAVYAYRARLLLLAAGEPTGVVGEVLATAGETEIPLTPSIPTVNRAELATVITNQDPMVLPAARPAELADLLDRIAEIALRERRYDRALEAWQLLEEAGPTVESVEGRARTLLARGEAEAALEALDGGIGVAVAPWPDDLAVIARDRRAAALVRLLDLRAEILAPTHPVTALSDKGTADLLAGRSEKSPIEDRVHTTGLAVREALKERYRAPAAETALNQAEAALDAGDHQAALEHSAASIFLFAWSDMADWRLDCARAHAVQARALEVTNQLDAALLAWEVALLLRPEAPGSWWESAGELHRRSGPTEAAFARHATARARQDTWDDLTILNELHRGPGPVLEAAQAMAVPVPPPQTHDQATIQRGVAFRFDGAQAVGEPDSGSKPPVVGEPPRVGVKLPAWSVQSTTGPIDSEALRGRAVALIFWVADCASCLAAISESGLVARDLRKTGRDVAVVAVSMDQEERFFDELRRLDRARVTLAHDPALGYRLGVTRAPTIFVVDPAGTLQFASVGWQGPGAFERALRRALSE